MASSSVTEIRLRVIKIIALVKVRFHEVFTENYLNDGRKHFLLGEN